MFWFWIFVICMPLALVVICMYYYSAASRQRLGAVVDRLRFWKWSWRRLIPSGSGSSQKKPADKDKVRARAQWAIAIIAVVGFLVINPLVLLGEWLALSAATLAVLVGLVLAIRALPELPTPPNKRKKGRKKKLRLPRVEPKLIPGKPWQIPWFVLVGIILGGIETVVLVATHTTRHGFTGTTIVQVGWTAHYVLGVIFLFAGYLKGKALHYLVELKEGRPTGRKFLPGPHWLFPVATELFEILYDIQRTPFSFEATCRDGGRMQISNGLLRWRADPTINDPVSGEDRFFQIGGKDEFDKMASGLVKTDMEAILGTLDSDELVQRKEAIILWVICLFKLGRRNRPHEDQTFLATHYPNYDSGNPPRPIDIYDVCREKVLEKIDKVEDGESFLERTGGAKFEDIAFEVDPIGATAEALELDRKTDAFVTNAAKIDRIDKATRRDLMAVQGNAEVIVVDTEGGSGALPLVHVNTGKQGPKNPRGRTS